MSIVAAVLAKVAAISIPVKATAVGLAVAVGATTGVVAHAAVTPPDPDLVPESTQEVVDVGEEAEEPAGQDTEDPGDERPTLPEAASFGQSVAADARDGGVIGPDIAERAHARAEERRADAIPDHFQAERERTRPEVGDVTPEVTEPRGRPENPSQRP